VIATSGVVTFLQVTVVVSQIALEGHAGEQTAAMHAPLTQAKPLPHDGKHAPCGTTQTAGLCEVRQTAGFVQSLSLLQAPSGETEQAEKTSAADAARSRFMNLGS
jgi:hypothetical protein